jgi:hypothetical protein
MVWLKNWPATRSSAEVHDRVQELRAKLDPVHLLKEIRALQQQLVDIADRPAFGEAAKPTSPTLEQFLSGLRTAWREGEVRPTSVAKAKPKRSRRRPDPFAAVTVELRGWFEAEPWHTSRELLERLQVQCPRYIPGRTAANTAAPPKGMAPRNPRTKWYSEPLWLILALRVRTAS